MNRLPFDKQVRVVSALVDGCSIRATERICDVHRDTIMRFGISLGDACGRLHDALFRDVVVNVLELDELWSYIGKKQRRLRPDDPPERGDQYTYIGLDAIHKAIVGFATGKRTQATTDAFALDLRARIVGRPQITNDGYAPYVEAVRAAFGRGADHAMIVKRGQSYADDERTVDGPRIIRLAGDPNPAHITTNHVERENLSVRMGCRRFSRKTNAFSKQLPNHLAAVALYVAHHNFCRVHGAIRTTPAMALGVTEHVWSVAELIDAALSIAPEPAPPHELLGELAAAAPAAPRRPEAAAPPPAPPSPIAPEPGTWRRASGAPPVQTDPVPFKEIVRQEAARVERDLIVHALEQTGGNVTRAARQLGLSRKGLQNKLKEFGL